MAYAYLVLTNFDCGILHADWWSEELEQPASGLLFPSIPRAYLGNAKVALLFDVGLPTAHSPLSRHIHALRLFSDEGYDESRRLVFHALIWPTSMALTIEAHLNSWRLKKGGCCRAVSGLCTAASNVCDRTSLRLYLRHSSITLYHRLLLNNGPVVQRQHVPEAILATSQPRPAIACATRKSGKNCRWILPWLIFLYQVNS